jgi:hypothetical protein
MLREQEANRTARGAGSLPSQRSTLAEAAAAPVRKPTNATKGREARDHVPLSEREAKQGCVAGHCRRKHLAEIEKGQRIHTAGCEAQQRQARWLVGRS